MIGWVADPHDPPGGAELTQAEFLAAAPVEVVTCPPGGVVSGLERYVVHNHMFYEPSDLERIDGRVIRYHHDVRVQSHIDADTDAAVDIFCSPLQREAMGYGDSFPIIPPALDLSRFKKNGRHRGTVWLGRFYAQKGLDLVAEYAKENGTIDVYGRGPTPPEPTRHLNLKGELDPLDVPKVLSRYKTFIHLPKAVEPFGRSVVEAWAAGCELVINKLVGARYWMEEDPEGLQTAAEDFWDVVLN